MGYSPPDSDKQLTLILEKATLPDTATVEFNQSIRDHVIEEINHVIIDEYFDSVTHIDNTYSF